LENLRLNDLEKAVVPINKALGARAGHADVHPGAVGNRGTATISFDAQSDTVEVSTLDREVQRVIPTSPSVALIKIDVEGAELDVLKGSLSTIDKHMPVLCVEIHTARNLRKVLSILGRNPYWIIDCRGYSPTYILEATNSLLPRRYIVNSLWLTRAALPLAWLKIRWYLARIAQMLSVGKWDPPA
jgi:FkbM family methyltransferase